MSKTLTVASHERPASYWEGGHYELNLSFDTLRDKQWQRTVQAIWDHPAVFGPLADRYTPGSAAAGTIPVQVPPPTATLTQHGQLKIGDAVIGCDVQATRSLFECISVLVPVGMFDGITVGDPIGPQLEQQRAAWRDLDAVLYDIALQVYDLAPFRIAAIGYERGCQLPAELQSNPDLCRAFLKAGNTLVQDDVLRAIQFDLSPYQQVRANLRWLPLQA